MGSSPTDTRSIEEFMIDLLSQCMTGDWRAVCPGTKSRSEAIARVESMIREHALEKVAK